MAAHPRLRAGALVAAAAGSVAGAVGLERRHLRTLAADEDYVRLTSPARGRTLPIRSADGTALHAELFGPDDADTVVLAHGWVERLALWGQVIAELVDGGLRVVAYDLRGHGASGPAESGEYTIERLGEDVEAVLRASIPDGRQATVAGHSLGAMSIAAWAQRHDVGARVRAAAMINTGLGDLLTEHLLLGPAGRVNPRLSRAVMSARGPVVPFSMPLQEAVVRYTAFGPEASSAMVAFCERMLIGTPADVRAACGAALSDMDLWHALPALTVPTLVIAGDRDRLTPPSHSRRITAGLPRPAGLIELPGCGHMGPLERPAEVARALATLSEETAPGSENSDGSRASRPAHLDATTTDSATVGGRDIRGASKSRPDAGAARGSGARGGAAG